MGGMNVTVARRTRPYRTVTFDRDRNTVNLIEQRLLPHEFRIVKSSDYSSTAAAIRDMVVRGAGAGGEVTAAGVLADILRLAQNIRGRR